MNPAGPDQKRLTLSARAARALVERRRLGAGRCGAIEARLGGVGLNAHAFMAAVFPGGKPGQWTVHDVLGWVASGEKVPAGFSWDGLVAYALRGP